MSTTKPQEASAQAPGTWFDKYGNLTGEIPAECASDCSTPGQPADESVEYWTIKLGFSVPREQAIRWLREYGAWPLESDEYDTGLNQMSDEDLAHKVLWLACCDMREQGEWFGLIH